MLRKLAEKFKKVKRSIVVDDTAADVKRRSTWNGYCSQCGKANHSGSWCNPCDRKALIDKFNTWSTGNKDLDLFIQETQRTAKSYYEYLEYVPYDRFIDVRLLAQGGFAKAFTATWLDGKRDREWSKDNEDNSWIKGRTEPCMIVLKVIDNSSKMEQSFISGLKLHYQFHQKSGLFCSCYGITRDPETMNYALILEYFSDGDLRKSLANPDKKLTWMEKLYQLRWICENLQKYHEHGYVHRDLHGGNILLSHKFNFNYLTDFELTRPADSPHPTTKEVGIYGVIPYMAPELFRGKPHSKASDIYAVGIIMSELASEELAFYDRDHDVHLQSEIIDGLRPEVPPETPKCYKNLMDRCLSGNPRDRPAVQELCYLFYKWDDFYNDNGGGDDNDDDDDDDDDSDADEVKQFEMADEQWEPKQQQKARHPGAIYTSRLITHVIKDTTSTSISTCWRLRR